VALPDAFLGPHPPSGTGLLLRSLASGLAEPGEKIAFGRPPMRKPRKEAAGPFSWAVYIFRKKLTWLGRVEASDRDEALKKAIEQHRVREADRWRVSVQQQA
jgi:hypothetical protein